LLLRGAWGESHNCLTAKHAKGAKVF
jgi:hypothetical protein